jgi:hypothetical protein
VHWLCMHRHAARLKVALGTPGAHNAGTTADRQHLALQMSTWLHMRPPRLGMCAI